MRFAEVYVHGKIAIFDDEWTTIGSADITSFSMNKHSEMNIAVRDRKFAKALHNRLCREHLRQNLHRRMSGHDIFRLWQARAQMTEKAMNRAGVPALRLPKGRGRGPTRPSSKWARMPDARIVPFRPPYAPGIR